MYVSMTAIQADVLVSNKVNIPGGKIEITSCLRARKFKFVAYLLSEVMMSDKFYPL